MPFLLLLFFIFHDLHPVVLGIENYHDSFFKSTKDRSFIFITNQTGLTQSGKRSIDALLKKNITISHIAAPEHGIAGVVEAGKNVEHATDAQTQIPVISLYKNGSGQLMDPVLVQASDGILFDIQDCGMRHYTFISTLYKTLQMAIACDREVIIFDRPNFLGPVVAGPVVESDVLSFISIAPIPLRYGLTIGELALYFNRFCLDSKARVHVVPMREYNPSDVKSCKVLAHLSPNIASLQSCYGYSFLGVVGEIRPFDVGIDTDQAFRVLMLPQSLGVTMDQWSMLIKLLQKYHIRSQYHSSYSTRKKMMIEGLSLFIDDITKVSNFDVIVEIIQWALNNDIRIQYSESFDKAIGTKKIREFCEKKDYVGLKMAKGTSDCTLFVNCAQECLLYKQQLTVH